MIPVQQTISASGWDSKLPGDCVRACYASILERPIEEVPHFVAGEVRHEDGSPMDWYSGVNEWLRREGYLFRIWHHTYYKHVDCQIAWRAERDASGIRNESRDMLWIYDARDQAPWYRGYWIASVISENFPGATHAVVMLNGDVVHDPSPLPRQTPYKFVGETRFVVEDPVVARRAA